MFSGLPHLLQDSSLWHLVADDGLCATLAASTLKRWRSFSNSADFRQLRGTHKVLEGFKLQPFLDKVERFESWLLEIDENSEPSPAYRRIASVFVMNGFTEPLQLEGVDLDAFVSFVDRPPEVAIVHRAIKACVGVKRCRIKEIELGFQTAHFEELGISDRKGPLAKVYKLAELAASDPVSVHVLFHKRAEALRMQSQGKSLNSVRAGLSCWHTFAMQVLRYPPNQSLLPTCANHVAMWIE
eukprot:3542103-Amphidinium_carterae.1